MQPSEELCLWLANAEIGDYRTKDLPGNLAEIHAVPGGWIYVFKDQMLTSGGNELQIHTQFVPDNRNKYPHNLHF